MPIVFSAKLDGSEAIRHYHISLVASYLREARRHALASAPAGALAAHQELND